MGKQDNAASQPPSSNIEQLTHKCEELERELDALKKTNSQRLQRIIESAPFGAHIYELCPDGRLVFIGANTAADRILGVCNAQFIGKTIEEAFPPLIQTQIPTAYKHVALSGERFETEMIEYHDEQISGAYEVFAFQMAPRQMTAFFRDITARKQTEQTLRESEEKWRAILEATEDGILLADADTKKLLVVNTAASRMLGYTAEEFQNMTVLDIHPEEDLPYVLEQFAKLCDGKKLAPDIPVKRKDGSVFYADVASSLVWIGNNKYLVGSFRDITERMRTEDVLRQSEKMSAIGQLAGGVAHDFNNQLTVILGYADVIASRSNDRDIKQCAEDILVAATRSADLTRQLLAFARKGQYQTIAVEIHKIIGEVVNIFSRSIDKRINIVQLLHAKQSRVTGDPSQLQNMLFNLALNARDAMPEGGELTFATEVVQLDEQYCRQLPYEIVPGQYLQIDVRDNGIGMSKDVQRHLFEPFFTTKAVGKGTGMGLAAVYGTIKSHKGAISVVSDIGQGSTFKLYLPLNMETGLSTSEPRRADIIKKETASILLVDDEDLVRNVAAKMLRESGYRVSTCADGFEAVGYYRQSWQQTDLVILDMVMPRKSGKETFAEMRQINPKIKILLSSGYSINGETQKILDDGAWGFLQKPFRQNTLLASVAEALKKA